MSFQKKGDVYVYLCIKCVLSPQTFTSRDLFVQPRENVWVDYGGHALANVKLNMRWWLIQWYCLRQQTANHSYVLHGYHFQTFKQSNSNSTIFLAQSWADLSHVVHDKHSKCSTSTLRNPTDLARLYILSVLLNKAYSCSPAPPSAV